MTKQFFNKEEYKNLRKKLRGSMAKSETWLWTRLKGRQIQWKFRRQHGIGPYVTDFFCPNLQLAVEVDGISHDRKERAGSDTRRDKYLSTLGIKVLRFTSEEIMYELDRVIENIYQECERIAAVQEHHRHPHLTSPFLGGGQSVWSPPYQGGDQEGGCTART